MEKSKKRVLKSLYILLVVLCLICIGVLLFLLMKDQKAETAMEEQQQMLEDAFVEKTAEQEAVAEEEKAELPIDFEGLMEVNPEIYAWIRVPDTKIDYPILQHEGEDQSYYLTRDIHGKTTQAGSIYTEYYNNKHFQDPNTIIYGHNMKNGSMFHNVRYFAEQEYFDEHEELYIYMPGKILKYQIINCYVYDDRHLLAAFDLSDETVHEEYLEDIMRPRSMYTMIRQEVELSTEDKLITLSTCVANQPNSRRLLQAVLVEEIEAEYRGTVNGETDKEAN